MSPWVFGTPIDSLARALELALPLVIAHVLYGLPRADAHAGARITLHNGDDFDAATDDAPRIERLAAIRAVTRAGSSELTGIVHDDRAVSIDVTRVEAPGWVVVETRPAFIELPADRFEEYLRYEGLSSALDARRDAGASDAPGREIYSKYAKTALDGGISEAARDVARVDLLTDLLTDPIGLPIELLPLAAPLASRASVASAESAASDASDTSVASIAIGDRLTLLALVDGEPAADLQVRVHHKPSHDAAPREVACVRTDDAGHATVTIDAPGFWRFHTISMTRGEDADWRSRWASLTFRI